jgi:hypothetical protein
MELVITSEGLFLKTIIGNIEIVGFHGYDDNIDNIQYLVK